MILSRFCQWLVVALPLAAQAQTEIFNTGFAVPPTMGLQGSATFVPNRLRLTPATPNRAGAAWYPTKRYLEAGFETMFQFQISSGGEGLAFVVQNNALPALGRAGSGLGLEGVPNSLAVEFDAVSSTDITDLAGAHVSVQTRGAAANSAADWVSIGAGSSIMLANGGIHTARIRYVPGTLEVYLDDLATPLVSTSVTLTNFFALEHGQAWFGLVAANGAVGATHEVLNWSVTLAATPLVVALASPLDGASAIAPGTFTIEATASGPDAVTLMEFFANGQRLFGTNGGPYRFVWDLLPGAYTLVAVATDAAGRKVASAPVRTVAYPSEPVIGVNFATGSSGEDFMLNPPDEAGVIPQRYWNNALVFTNGNGALQNLRNAAGNITPVDIGYDFVSRGEEPANEASASADHGLMRAYGAATGASNVIIQVQQIPYAIYDVILYLDGANAGADRVSQVRGPGARSVFARDAAWTSFAGVYAAANGASDAGAATPAGNYIRLNGLTGANLSITNTARFASDGSPLGAINGIQIFPSVWDRSSPVILTRGPYLQMGTPHGMTVRWRSNRPVPSRVRYGTNASNLSLVTMDLTERQEHTVVLTNLAPDTRYYYSVGTTETNLVTGTNYFFLTSPLAGKPTRVWVLGDSGTANANAAAVRDAFNTLNGSRYVDVWLMLGDNAYNSGTDSEFQAAVFNMYTNTLPQTPLWPTIGNHETGQSHTPVSTTPYLSIFNLPANGEAGGVPSGTERYYSFDYGNIHFVCLDSMTNERTTNGPMANWIHADLQANTNEWIIVFFHHPPYTKGSHDSDDPNGADFELVEMRQNIAPILEAYGVDLVMSGHSHCYERSYPLRGHYGYSTELDPSMILDMRSGNPAEEGGGPYTKVSDGTIYMVDGSSGQATFGTMDHPVMYRSILNLGSVILDIHTNQLVARFLRENGEVQDTFTIIKQSPPAAPTPLHVVSTVVSEPGVNNGQPNGAGGEGEGSSFEFGFLLEPVSQSASVGADVLFLGTAFSDYPVSYQWRKEGSAIPGETDDFLYLVNVDLADIGAYDLVVTANSLSITSQVAMLNVSGTFTKVLTGPLVTQGGNSAGCAWGDFDNDGDLDVFIARGANAFNSLFRNNGSGGFSPVDAGSVTADTGNSSGATWADYDNNRWLDLLVLNTGNTGTNFLYRNNGDGSFTRVTTGIGGEVGNAQTAAWADYDRDGWLDVVTGPTGGGFGGPASGGLYRNEAGTLVRITNSALAGLNQGQSAAWTDFDNDGDLDLFFALLAGGGFFGGPGHEQLYINGAGGFITLQEDPLVSSGNSSTTASWADYDGDGYMDVFVGNIDGQVKFLFRNTGSNSFVQVLGEIAGEAGANESAIWGDYDNDGWIDLFVANNLAGGSFLFRNTGSGTFTMVDAGSPSGDRAKSVGAAWVDVDDNGFLDLFVTNLGDNNYLYRNNGNTNGWLTIKCAAYLSNRSAVGAKVKVLATIGGSPRWQVREIAARDSSGSPSSLRAEFGLGDAMVATMVRVEWPSGLVTELQDVPVRQIITVEEPPTISIADAQAVEGDVGTSMMHFVVTLRAPSTNVVTVDFSTRNGTAGAGAHYVATNGTLSFAPGETNLTISVAILGNLTAVGGRNFLVVLTNAVNMPMGRGTATGTIVEDDPLTLTIDNSSVVEGDTGTTNFVFRIYLNKAWTNSVTTDFGSGNNNALAGLDYVSTNGSLVFNPGEVSKEVSVIVLPDTLNEANEVMFMNVSNVVGATPVRFRASGTIMDNDALPSILVVANPFAEGNLGTSQLVLNVGLSTRSGRTVSFAYATANGTAVAPTDYVTKSGTISMTAGVTNTNIVVVVSGDTVVEGDEVFYVSLTNPVGAIFETNPVPATIGDDDFRLAPSAAPGGSFTFYGINGRYHRVERTFSLAPPVQWTTVPGASALLGNGAAIQVSDPTATNAPQRFYRVRLLQ